MRGVHRFKETGFSFLEVLFALTVGLFGTVAVFSLQFSNVRGNLEARELAAATNLAERAVALLQGEATQWFGTQLPAPYLNREPRRWHSLTEHPVNHNLRPHIRHDARQGTALLQQRYCIHYWLDPLIGTWDGLIGARVRVVWPRDVTLGLDVIESLCGGEEAENFVETPGRWRSLTLPILLRRHPR